MKRSDSVRGGFAVLASLVPRALRAAWAGGIALAIGLAATAGWTLSTHRLYRSEAIVLFELQEMTVEEIAEIQRTSLSSVKSRLSRGRERLRRHYAASEELVPPAIQEQVP